MNRRLVRLTRSAPMAGLCLTLALAAAPTRAEDPIGSSTGPNIPFTGCRYYEHRNYGGHHFDVGANRSVSYTGDAWNDQVSSIACSTGCETTIYENANFGGASATWGSYIDYVGSFWNDRISSMKVVCRPPPAPRPKDLCRPGFVWRNASENDHVCVTPGERSLTAADNAAAASHIRADGVCVSGYVWREAFPGDHVCVTTVHRQIAALENRDAASHVAR